MWVAAFVVITAILFWFGWYAYGIIMDAGG
jgi:hypothetical protein